MVLKLTDFDNGNLPLEYSQDLRLLDNSNPAVIDWQNKFQQIANRLLKDKAQPFRFYISANDSMNAEVITAVEPPIITINRGMLNIVENEDQLAAVIAHELTHHKIFLRLGLHENSKAEETLAADTWPVKALQDAGYAPIGVEQVFEKMPTNPIPTYNEFADVHAYTPNRVRVAKNARAALMNMTGQAENTTITPLDKTMLEAINKVGFTSWIQEAIQNSNYAELDNIGKMHVLLNIIDKTRFINHYDYKELAELFKNLKINASNQGELDKFGEIYNRAIAPEEMIDVKNGSVYLENSRVLPLFEIIEMATIENMPKNRRGKIQVGVAKELAEAAEKFIFATSREEASRAALDLINANQRMRDDIFFSKLSPHSPLVPYFRMPSTEAVHSLEDDLSRHGSIDKARLSAKEKLIKLPYISHVKWAREDLEKGESPQISHALNLLEVNDVNIPKLYPEKERAVFKRALITAKDGKVISIPRDELLQPGTEVQAATGGHPPEEFVIRSHHGMSKPANDNFHLGYNLNNLRIDDEGFIYGIRTSGRVYPANMTYKSYAAEETKRLNKIDASQIKAVAEADWRLLEGSFADFKKFHTLYGDYLTPEWSIIEGGDSFAKAYIQKAEALLEQDPQKYRPYFKSFFSLEYREGEKKFNIGSLIRDYRQLHELNENTIYLSTEEKAASYKTKAFPHAISINHPFSQFILDNKFGFFTLDQKQSWIEHFCRHHSTTIDEQPLSKSWTFDPRRIFGQPEMQTIGQYIEWHNSLLDPNSTGLVYKDGNIHQNTMFDAAVLTELIELLEKFQPELSLDELQYINNIKGAGFHSTGYTSEISNLLLPQAVRIAETYVNSNKTLGENIRAYRILESSGMLIDRADLKNAFEEKIVSQIESLGPTEEARRAAYGIICKGAVKGEVGKKISSTYKPNLRNPEIKDRLTNIIANSYALQIGNDDGSEEYFNKADVIVKNICRVTAGTVRYQLISKLADATESQRRLSYAMRDQVEELTMRELANDGNVLSAGELSTHRINQSEEMRFATLKFLRSPLTSESLATYRAIIKEKYDDQVLLTDDEKSQVRNIFNVNKVAVSDNAKNEILSSYHQNFNALPLEGKTLYTDLILFPTRREKQVADIMSSKEKQWVLDQVLPLPTVTSSITSFAKRLMGLEEKDNSAIIGRDAVEAYLKVSDPEEQRLLLSAMVISSDPGRTTHSHIGRSLKEILYAMGPAGVKIAQSIHSHRDTPVAIKNEMEEAKIMAARPRRWTIFEIIDQTIEPPVYNIPGEEGRIEHVGKILGSGAYGITVELLNKDGSYTALTLLRPNARARAERGFVKFGEAAEILIAKHPQLKPLTDMVAQAHNMSVIETDMELAAEQSIIAAENYNGLKVKVDNLDVHFSAAPWLRHGQNRQTGDGYKETSVVLGEHFLDMPETTPQELALKQKIAKAIATAEAAMIASGRCFDHDRHGGQQRIVIEGNQVYVGNFDFGAMSLKPPSKEQKEALAKVLMDTFGGNMFRNLFTSGNIGEEFSRQMGHFKDKPEIMDYLASVERGVLALGDTLKFLPVKERISVMATTMLSDMADPELKQAFKTQLPLLYPLVEKHLKSNIDPKLSISRQEKTEQKLKTDNPQKPASFVERVTATTKKTSLSKTPETKSNDENGNTAKFTDQSSHWSKNLKPSAVKAEFRRE